MAAKSEQANVPIPPNDIETERAVLGAMMIEPEAANLALELLDETIFYDLNHRTIFLAAERIHEKNRPVDLVTLTETLNGNNKLEEIGGAIYLSDLATCVASAANIEHHAYVILRKAIYRKTIHYCSRAITDAMNQPDDESGLLNRIEAEIFALQNYKRTSRLASHIGRGIKQVFAEIESIKEQGIETIGIPSGYKYLDKITSGWQKGNTIVLAGRPSMGKTALALMFAEYSARKNTPVAFFSLEMTYRELSQRVLCSIGNVNTYNARCGMLNPEEMLKLGRKAEEASTLDIYVDDSPDVTVQEIRSRSRRLITEYGVELIIVDYIGLMGYRGKYESQQQKIQSISNQLKSTAKELDIPIIILSQLSRAVEQRDVKRPQLSDLRDSGAIEQDADLVMFVYRPGHYRQKEDAKKKYEPNETEVIVAKQRNGPLGSIWLWFDLRTGQIHTMEQERDDEPVGDESEGTPF